MSDWAQKYNDNYADDSFLQHDVKSILDKELLQFGKILRQLRRSKKYTLKKLAEKVGTSKEYICRYENGEHYPNLKMLFALSEALEHNFINLNIS